MKKIFALFFVVVLTVSMFTGCSREKTEEIKYSRTCIVDPAIFTAEELAEKSDLILEGVVIGMSAEVQDAKTGKTVIFPVASGDSSNYGVVTVYTILVTQPYKGAAGVLVRVASAWGNWYDMGPERKRAIERVGLEPKQLLIHYSIEAELEVGSSYLFCISEHENGQLFSLYYRGGLDCDGVTATKIKEQFTPQIPPLLILAIIVAVLAAAAVTTVLIILKKKKKPAPECPEDDTPE